MPAYLIAKKDGRVQAHARLLEPQRGPEDRYAIGPFPTLERATQHACELGYTREQVELWIGGQRVDN